MHCKTVALLSASAVLAAASSAMASEDGNSSVTTPKNMEASGPGFCCNFMVNGQHNLLTQKGLPEADSKVSFFVSQLLLCTAEADLLPYQGAKLFVQGLNSPMLASHIHGPVANSTADNGQPIINYCGQLTGKANPIDDGTDYLDECGPESNMNGAYFTQASNATGNVVAGTTANLGDPNEVVKSVCASPEMYYFNVHTQASFAHWQSVGEGPLGAARGTLTKIPVPDMDTAAKAATAPDSMGAGIYADDKPTEIPPGSATSQAGNATTDK